MHSWTYYGNFTHLYSLNNLFNTVLLIFTKITRFLFYGPSGSTNDRVAILIYFKPLL